MADKDDSEKAKAQVPEEKRPTTAAASQRVPWVPISIGIGALLVVLLLVAIGWWLIVASHGGLASSRDGMGMMSRSGFNSSQRPAFGSGGDYNGRRGFANLAASGVITAINGDTITVSGGGKQVTVKKTSSTTISGSKSDIAVNDTVMVVGNTADDGTVTATRIMVRNEMGNRSVSDDTDQVPGV